MTNYEDLLLERYFCDLKKKDVDKFERATMIRGYIDRKGLSIRKFSEEIGESRSTVEDWLLYSRISEEEYNKLVSEGKGYREIYKALRRNKLDDFKYSDLDAYLIDIRPKLKHYRKNGEITPKTFILIDELVDALNSLSAELRIKSKKVRS